MSIWKFISENSDVIPIVVSSAALLATVTFALLTQRSKGRDVSRLANGEFYDVITELLGLNKENEELRRELGEDYRKIENTRRKSIIKEQRELLLYRANELLKESVVSASDIAFVIIAGSLSDAGKHAEAVEKYRLAVDRASSDWQRALHRRAYGRSLILSNKHEIGRGEMLQAHKELMSLGSTEKYDKENAHMEATETIKRLVYACKKEHYIAHIRDDFNMFEGLVKQTTASVTRKEFLVAAASLKFEIEALLPNSQTRGSLSKGSSFK